jgi:hypothetical protein
VVHLQVVFRYLLFLQTMLRARPPQTLSLTDTLSQAGDMSGTLDLTLSSKVPHLPFPKSKTTHTNR